MGGTIRNVQVIRTNTEMKYPYEALYDQGLAVGNSNILEDSISLRFRNEEFTFPTMEVMGIAKYNGYFYTAKVEALRLLKNG